MGDNYGSECSEESNSLSGNVLGDGLCDTGEREMIPFFLLEEMVDLWIGCTVVAHSSVSANLYIS